MNKNISLIVAVSENNAIGIDNKLPWHLPADLKYFKERTAGKTVIMGRKTYESIIDAIGKPLPNRLNVVITTSSPDYNTPDGVLQFGSLNGCMNSLNHEQLNGSFIIGGNLLFKDAINFVDTMYITRVHTTVDGDVFFPKFNKDEWELTWSERHEADEKNTHSYTFEEYKRKRP